MGVLWLPSALSGLHSWLVHRPETHGWPTEVSRAISSLGTVALISYVLIRAKQPLARFGAVKMTATHIWVTVGLCAAMTAAHVATSACGWIVGLQGQWDHPGVFPSARIVGPGLVRMIVVPISALSQEVLMRGYLVTRLMDLWGYRWVAVLISAVGFSLWHVYQGWTGPAATLVDGLIFATVLLKTRSVWPCVIAHATYNMLVSFGVVTSIVSGILHRAAGS